jgi:hypothetical protein
MTPPVEDDIPTMMRNLPTVASIMKRSTISSVLFTGKTEPLAPDSIDYVYDLSRPFLHEASLEIQTNGMYLTNNNIELLEAWGFHVIAISIDSWSQIIDLISVITKIKEEKMLVRLTINMSNRLKGTVDFSDPAHVCRFCYETGVHQVTFRVLSIPSNCQDEDAATWIRCNGIPADRVWRRLRSFIETNDLPLLRETPNLKIFDYKGVSVAYSEYCIQEKSETGNTRSLIFQSDGHLYTSWGSLASILF